MYLADWEASGLGGMCKDFDIPESALDGAEVLLAFYLYECYSGDAFVLLRRGEKYYEVNGSHCSCYGLEGQWDEEETSLAALQYRVDNASAWEFEGHKDALIEVLKAESARPAQEACVYTRDEHGVWHGACGKATATGSRELLPTTCAWCKRPVEVRE